MIDQLKELGNIPLVALPVVFFLLLAMPLRARRDYWMADSAPRLERDFPAIGGPDRMAD